jgi:hypothetical protein
MSFDPDFVGSWASLPSLSSDSMIESLTKGTALPLISLRVFSGRWENNRIPIGLESFKTV